MKVLLLLCFLLFIPFVSGVEDTSEEGIIYAERNTTYNFNVPCALDGWYCNTNSICNLTLTTQQGDFIVNNQRMQVLPQIVNYTVPNTALTLKSRGGYSIKCTDPSLGINASTNGLFYVTGNGEPPAEGGFSFFIYGLFIVVTLALTYTLILNVARVATLSTTIYDVIVSWSFFILLIIVNFLGNDYLLTVFIEDLTGTFIKITTFSHGILPLIGFFIAFIARSFEKRRPLHAEEYLGRQFNVR